MKKWFAVLAACTMTFALAACGGGAAAGEDPAALSQPQAEAPRRLLGTFRPRVRRGGKRGPLARRRTRRAGRKHLKAPLRRKKTRRMKG